MYRSWILPVLDSDWFAESSITRAVSGHVSITAQENTRNLYWVMWISKSNIPLIFIGMLPVRYTLKLLVILNWTLQGNVRKPLKILGFRIGTELTVTFSVTPIERSKLELGLRAIEESNPTYHPTMPESRTISPKSSTLKRNIMPAKSRYKGNRRWINSWNNCKYENKPRPLENNVS